jgi:pilus assembly protein Flp/PilA
LLKYIKGAIFALNQDKRAVTAIEYALIAALISVVIISALTNLGHGVQNTFKTIAGEL